MNIEYFEIIKKIYDSYNGSTYKAINKNTNKIVFLKKIINNIEHGLNEYNIGIMLSHKNIICVKKYYTLNNKNLLLEQEYINGGDLFDNIDSLSIIDKKKYMLDIINGLEYIHSQNIIHMDIKLENIVIDNNVAKICDFGMAIKKNSEPIYGIGTQYYYSPEIVKYKYNILNKIIVNEFNDIWSLGISFYLLITKSFPWKEANIDDNKYNYYIINKNMNNNEWKYFSNELKELFTDIFIHKNNSLNNIRKIVDIEWFNMV